MKKYSFLFKKCTIFSLCLLMLNGQFAFSKPKKKAKEKESTGQVKATYDGKEKTPEIAEVKQEPVVEVSAEESDKGDSVKLPSQKPTFFSKIEPEILNGIENGAPDSIRLAMQKIRKSEEEYIEAEKVLIYISTELMRTVWTSEKITWEVYDVTTENSYTGAIASANKGVFDSSTGNIDFLSTLLPALVIFAPYSDDSVNEPCETAMLKALSLNDNSVLANYMLGYFYEKLNDTERALPYFRKAYGIVKNSQEITLAYAKALRVTGDLEGASKVLATISIETTDVKILKQNAYLSFASGDYVTAEEYVGRVLQQNPNDLEFVLFRAKILVEKNDYIHAVSLLDVYARQDSTSLDYLLLRSRVQLDWSKNTTAATENVEKALQLYPDNTQALMFAARISSTIDAPVAGKYADELAARVLEKDPENTDAMLYALNGLVQRNNWQEAYAISTKLISTNRINSEIVEKHINICISLDKNNEAYEFAKKMAQIYPDDERVLQAYIYSYCQTGSRDAVVKYLDSTIASTTSSKMKSYLYYRRSFLQFSEDSALADLRSSLISNPRNSDALFRLYEIYYAKTDYRKAQYYLRQVVAINPNDNSLRQLNEALTKLIQ